MAVSKKYAGLPDLDPAPEIYETPELTDDASTVQTGTLHTESPAPSEDGDDRLDRQRIDRDAARRRFEPTLVNARDVNFSDTIATGERRSYKTKSRRRRRRDSEASSGSEDETLARRIARLKREAEEVRLELQRRDEEGDEFRDTVESQDKAAAEESDEGVDELSRIINNLQAAALSKSTNGRPRDELMRGLATGPREQKRQPLTNTLQGNGPPPTSEGNPATLSALASFSDRLTALEAALGIPSIDPSTQPASILPTLQNLSTHINTLSSTLALTKPSTTMTMTTTTTTASSTLASSSLPNLDALSSRLRTLTAESEKLTAARKAAVDSLNELHEARLRDTSSRHHHHHHQQNISRPGSASHPQQQLPNTTTTTTSSHEEQQRHATLFLDEQSAKITALYQVLPTIQNLQPLLPVVLERLRTLSVIHAGAAEASMDLEEVQRRQAEAREEIGRWREAVESVEKGMGELGLSVKGNVEVVSELVRGVEDRVAKLQRR